MYASVHLVHTACVVWSRRLHMHGRCDTCHDVANVGLVDIGSLILNTKIVSVFLMRWTCASHGVPRCADARHYAHAAHCTRGWSDSCSLFFFTRCSHMQVQGPSVKEGPNNEQYAAHDTCADHCRPLCIQPHAGPRVVASRQEDAVRPPFQALRDRNSVSHRQS